MGDGGETLVLYHGTTEDRLASILEHGLLPAGDRRVRGNWPGWRSSARGWCYLHWGFAAYFACATQKERGAGSGRPVVLQVAVPTEELYPDEDFIAHVLVREDGLALKRAQARAKRLIGRNQDLAGECLSHLGSVAVRGVPPQAILGYRAFTGFVEAAMYGADIVMGPLAMRTLGHVYRRRLECLFLGIEPDDPLARLEAQSQEWMAEMVAKMKQGGEP